MQEQLADLKEKIGVAQDLSYAGAVLNWDQSTYMPNGGAEARGRQMATLSRLAHEHATSADVGRLLDKLVPWAEQQDPDSDDAALVLVTKRDYDQAVRVPSEFIAELYSHIAKTYTAWTQARPNNDFAAVAPLLEKTLDLSRRYAEFFGPSEHIADPLIDLADQGMTVAKIREIFGPLREQLVPLVKTITEQPAADDSCLLQHYPEAEQLAFGESLIREIGYDFERGRQDKTHHPFMTKFSIGDVRITTRFRDNDLSDGLFSTIHETGHAVYELGVNPAYENTPLASGASAGTHESQSRLWENVVGRSRAFWQYAYPKAQAAFPSQLGKVDLDTFYRAINKVQRSLVRTDSDEVTYNLHVMIRFDLELALLEGKLAIRDLPEAWHERYRSDLGITAPDDRDGVLQDVHWYGGIIGGSFQGYTLGNILSAQIFDAAVKANPNVPTEISQGQFANLHNWLKSNMYVHGRKYSVPTLIRKVTGQDLSIEPYIRYLRTKYGELYSL
ncbi:carboxypeptidase M32 [Herpetosiphon llansteffanensis]|uniref:carboxypeptidase M32 n=1 Tax=Herpetosiphon llansteffanensis TaxID=2094568 RepID=UPI000D7C1B02|nr:carboxypeptidase M32 [Herpetosiphon llansteffanensis]